MPLNLLFFRLENLSTEWQQGAYNSANNPFGKVVRCQDCHMSLFPFAGTSSYTVGDGTGNVHEHHQRDAGCVPEELRGGSRNFHR